MDTNVFFNLICYLLGMIGRITAPEDVCDLIPESVNPLSYTAKDTLQM